MLQPKRLKPIIATTKMDDKLQKKIFTFFQLEIYWPLIETFKIAKIKTFENALSSALRTSFLIGQIQFAQGIIRGKFSAEITKELRALGSNYDKRINGFKIEMKNLPYDVQSAVGQATANFQKLNQDMLAKIDSLDINKSLDEVNFAGEFEASITHVDAQYYETVTKKINIQADLLPEQKKLIAEEYSNNLKLYIKDFADSEIGNLRTQVEENVFTGYRAENLQRIIKESYGVSERKAKFLARQETNLLTAKYKQTRYASGGIDKYEWSTTSHGGSGVRDSHKELNGQIFRFDNPPLISGTTRYCNPGEDFNCYCKAIPIFD